MFELWNQRNFADKLNSNSTGGMFITLRFITSFHEKSVLFYRFSRRSDLSFMTPIFKRNESKVWNYNINFFSEFFMPWYSWKLRLDQISGKPPACWWRNTLSNKIFVNTSQWCEIDRSHLEDTKNSNLGHFFVKFNQERFEVA